MDKLPEKIRRHELRSGEVIYRDIKDLIYGSARHNDYVLKDFSDKVVFVTLGIGILTGIFMGILIGG